MRPQTRRGLSYWELEHRLLVTKGGEPGRGVLVDGAADDESSIWLKPSVGRVVKVGPGFSWVFILGVGGMRGDEPSDPDAGKRTQGGNR